MCRNGIDYRPLPTRLPQGSSGADRPSTENITASTRQSLIMVNPEHSRMDTNYPLASTTSPSTKLVHDSNHRYAVKRDPASPSKETFHDNPLHGRFELFIDGKLAAFMKYKMNGGQLILLGGTEQPAFRDQGTDTTLMRHVVLNAHRRRVSLLPQCPMALTFLADHPQYRFLTAQPLR